MPVRTQSAALAVLLAAVVGTAIAGPPALAHHCGDYGTHVKGGWCLKKIKSKWNPPRPAPHRPFKAGRR